MEILESFSPMSVSGIIMENETAVHRITALQMWYKLKKRPGIFERTSDMVFCLRKTKGKKCHQPIIRYQNEKSRP